MKAPTGVLPLVDHVERRPLRMRESSEAESGECAGKREDLNVELPMVKVVRHSPVSYRRDTLGARAALMIANRTKGRNAAMPHATSRLLCLLSKAALLVGGRVP